TEEPGSLVAHIFDPDRWIVESSAEPDLARDDIERLRQEAERMLQEQDENVELTLKSLAQKLRYRISIREPLGQEEEQPDIQIVTLWGAKGLTADFVYIVGLCDEALPGPYDRDSTGLTEEEHELEQLRLLYVSLTRAKQVLVISRPQTILRGQVAALGLKRTSEGSQYRQQLNQCRFFGDVPAAHLPTSIDGAQWSGIELDSTEHNLPHPTPELLLD
ncbi:MAG TPA: 3'-5' exonuclease, partial [Solirubrobacteraceae bacterium]